MSPVGNPAFGPAGQQAAPPDGSQLLQVVGEMGPMYPPLPGAVLFTGEPATNGYSNAGLEYYSPDTQGVLYLTRIPVVAPHLSHIGFDPGLNDGAYIGKNRIGIYRSVHGRPTELVEEIGVLNPAGGDQASAENAFLETDFVGSEGETYWAGWTWQGGETAPYAWQSVAFNAAGFVWLPTDMDPGQHGVSLGGGASLRYPSWSILGWYNAADSWQESLHDTWNGFSEEYYNNGILYGGWMYRPRNGPADYGVNHALPETLPAQTSINYDDTDGEWYGFAPDGGNQAAYLNFRLLIRLAD